MVFDRIKKVIVKQMDIDESRVTMETSFIDDLGADSLDVVELIIAFESEFELEFDEDDIEKISTVKDVVEYFENLL